MEDTVWCELNGRVVLNEMRLCWCPKTHASHRPQVLLFVKRLQVFTLCFNPFDGLLRRAHAFVDAARCKLVIE